MPPRQGTDTFVCRSCCGKTAETVATPVAVPEAEYEDVKIPNIRKVIAKSMHDSLSNMAQLTLNTTLTQLRFRLTALLLKTMPKALVLPI